ncbi:MAG: hypothetical protein BGN97_08920 [Microbacterium sp. 69-10]|uniref:hypothetical protein n=1 Tax=Microbacterium sp. 69-10 TaxID=1895783 RepID=UPI00095CFC55|nr:hypothetical protein [Microbacterium sp. 69-10]OJU42464.1 MAG: hypothetical protein BGN97_08920 [Microbacterium sp. 69-10]
MTLTEHLPGGATVLFNRSLTLLCAGGAIALSGLLVLVAPDSDLLFAVYILLAIIGSAIPAMGLRRGGSVTGPRVLPRISLIIAGVIAMLLAVIAGVAIGRSRAVPLPWAWLGLPVLIVGIGVAAARACITAALVMSWAGEAPDVYGVLSGIQTWGAIGLGAAMIVVALTAYRRPVLPVATAVTP